MTPSETRAQVQRNSNTAKAVDQRSR